MRVLRLALAAVIMMIAVFGYAQSGPVRTDGATVIVNEVPVFEFKTDYSGASAQARASLVVQRIQSTTGPVTISGDGDQRELYRGSVLLTDITNADASAAGTSVGALASSWYAALKDALALPALKVPEATVRIPIGETRTVKLVGSKAFAATIMSSSYQVAKGQKTDDGLVIQGLTQGQAALTINAGNATATVNVEVLPYATSLPQTVTANVTGFPASEDIVQGAVEGAIRTQLRTVPGANVTFHIDNQSTLDTGSSEGMDVKVTVDAPRSFAKEGNVHVTLKNLPIAKRSEGELWYCNDPENLKQPEPLFSAHLLKESPVRLLYHHVNSSTYPLFVRIQLINDSDTAAQVIVMPGDAKPDKNPVLAGLLAADKFVRHWVTNSGEVVYIAPHCSMPLSLHRLSPGETMSGLCGLRLLSSGPDSLLLRADAIAPFEPDKQWAAAINSCAPWRYVGASKITYYDTAPTVTSNHIYPDPFKEENVDYQVGGRYGFVRIGQKPISNSSQDSALEGNFGVVYTIKATMTNPTNQASDIEVVFEASAGYAGALFVVNGDVKRTFPLPPKAETQLALIHLEPGASKSLTLITIPHSGGSYPATLTIRPVPDAKYRMSTGHR
jgi:hypothetical protein